MIVSPSILHNGGIATRCFADYHNNETEKAEEMKFTIIRIYLLSQIGADNLVRISKIGILWKEIFLLI